MKLLTIISLGIFIFVFACTIPTEFELPQWEVRVVKFPVMGADTIFIGKEITDENLRPIGSDSLYHIFFDGSQQIDVADNLKQAPVNPAPIATGVGNFSVDNSTNSVEIDVTEMFPVLIGLNGTSYTIPDAPITEVNKTITGSSYTNIVLEEGTLEITVNNDLNFPLGDTLYVYIKDNVNLQTVGMIAFNDVIAAGDSSTQSIDLSGQILSNDLSVSIEGNQNSTDITVDESVSLNIDVAIKDLKASSATADIPNQNLDISQSVDISTDSITVKSAVVSSGTITIDVDNGLPFPITVDIEFTDILDAGSPINQSITIGTPTDIDLAGKTLSPGADGMLDFVVTAATQSNNNEYTVNSTDIITSTVSVSEMQFSSVNADIDIGVEFPSFEEEMVDLDLEIPDINFEDITFTLDFINTPADMEITLDIFGEKDSETAQADYSFNIYGGQDNEVVLTNDGVLVNGTTPGLGSGLVDVINLLPEKIAFSGTAQIDDNDANLTTAPIQIDYEVDVGFVYSLPDGAVIEGDTLEISFADEDDPEQEQDMREIMRDYFNSGSFDIVIANGVPIGGDLTIRVADSTTALSTDPESWPLLTTFGFDPPVLDPATGNATSIPDQEISIGLTDAQIIRLSEADFGYWWVTLEAIPKGALHSTDLIILRKSFISGSVTVNQDLLDLLEDEDNKTNK
ncbi:hypothetical protein ACFL7D_10435, partial [candidate division KSB1 bacterium]